MTYSDPDREPLRDLLDEVVDLFLAATEQSLSDDAIRAKLREHKKRSPMTAPDLDEAELTGTPTASPAPTCSPQNLDLDGIEDLDLAGLEHLYRECWELAGVEHIRRSRVSEFLLSMQNTLALSAATAIRDTADAYARQVREEADAYAQRVREEADAYQDAALAGAAEVQTQIRHDAERDARRLVSEARAQAQHILDEAESHAAAIISRPAAEPIRSEEICQAETLYRSQLAGQRMLIVLENGTTKAQVEPLLTGHSDRLVLLITSQGQLAGRDHTHTVSQREHSAAQVMWPVSDPSRDVEVRDVEPLTYPPAPVILRYEEAKETFERLKKYGFGHSGLKSDLFEKAARGLPSGWHGLKGDPPLSEAESWISCHHFPAHGDLAALPAADFGAAAHADHVPPRTHAEQIVAGVWAEVLGVSQVGVHDNFFELGGDSIQSILVISRLRAAFGIDLSPRALFTAPTVAGVAALLDEADDEFGGRSSDPTNVPDFEATAGAISAVLFVTVVVGLDPIIPVTRLCSLLIVPRSIGSENLARLPIFACPTPALEAHRTALAKTEPAHQTDSAVVDVWDEDDALQR